MGPTAVAVAIAAAVEAGTQEAAWSRADVRAVAPLSRSVALLWFDRVVKSPIADRTP
jgi:hypothetical protein